MSFEEVQSLLGQPSDTTRRIPKKAFNPFYFGNDRFRTTYYYEGMGRVQFDIKGRVTQIDEDRNQSGGSR